MPEKLPINLNDLLRQRTVEDMRIEYKAGWIRTPFFARLRLCQCFWKLGRRLCGDREDCDANVYPLAQGPDLAAEEVSMEAAALFNVIVSEMSRQELQVTIGLKSAEHFRKAYVLPAIAAGCLEMTLLKPSNSRLQRHRLTATGLHWLQAKIQRSTR